MNWSSNKRIGLVLGGGVARGLLHVGVLEVLEGQGVPIDFVVGVSSGAMVGAAYCASGSHEQVRQVSELMRWDRIARPLRPSRASGFGVTFARLERWVEQTAGVTTFEQLKTPLIVVASDLMSGKPVVFQHGPLAPAVRASSSVPGMVEPLKLDGRLLVDGGITNNLPISIARQFGADVVIAVNCFPPPRAMPRSMFWQGVTAITWLLLQAGDDPHSADVLVEPDLDQVSLLRLASADLRHRGARAMIAQLPRL
ncbi:MAG: patatin-like phospholipase family protein, partial [Anaerolineae bacterium]